MNIWKRVLFIGPYHKKAKGGVNSVLKTYKSNFPAFNILSTFPFRKMLLNHLFFPVTLLKLVFKLSFGNYNIIHIHGASYGSFYRKFTIFVLIRILFKKKIIYHIHGAHFELFFRNGNRLLIKCVKYMISKVNMVVCLSKSWKEFFEKNFELKEIAVVNNIIPYPRNSSLPRENKGRAVNFLFLGRIGKRKGVFDLIDILVKNKAKIRGKAKFVFGGDGEVDKLKKIIDEESLGEIVEYVGWVDGKQKINLLNNSDIFILPSYNEGLPIAILEAMSYGLAIVSTKVGGIPEIVNKNGILVTPGNKNEIYDAINYFLINGYKQESKDSKVLAEKYYPDYVKNQLELIYQNI